MVYQAHVLFHEKGALELLATYGSARAALKQLVPIVEQQSMIRRISGQAMLASTSVLVSAVGLEIYRFRASNLQREFTRVARIANEVRVSNHERPLDRLDYVDGQPEAQQTMRLIDRRWVVNRPSIRTRAVIAHARNFDALIKEYYLRAPRSTWAKTVLANIDFDANVLIECLVRPTVVASNPRRAA